MNKIFKLDPQVARIGLNNQFSAETLKQVEQYNSQLESLGVDIETLFNEFLAKAKAITPTIDFTASIDDLQAQIDTLTSKRTKAITEAEKPKTEVELLTKKVDVLHQCQVKKMSFFQMAERVTDYTTLKVLAELEESPTFKTRILARADALLVGDIDTELKALNSRKARLTNDQQRINGVVSSRLLRFGYQVEVL